jgi:DNA-binding transcriptional ArsR family regulator
VAGQPRNTRGRTSATQGLKGAHAIRDLGAASVDVAGRATEEGELEHGGVRHSHSLFDEYRTTCSTFVEVRTTIHDMPAHDDRVEPELGALELPRVLHALSDPVRLDLVRQLEGATECRCGTFASPVSKSTLSHHLKVLREAGVTRTRSEGTTRLVSLRREDLDVRFPGLLDAVLSAQSASTAA